MKQSLSILSALLTIVILCSCSNASVPFSPKEQSVEVSTTAPVSIEIKPTGTSDPFVELSVFDDSESDALAFLGEPTKARIDSNTSELKYNEFEYKEYSYLGMLGDFVLTAETGALHEEGMYIREMLFVYPYPGAINWKASSSDDKYSANADDLRIAQENWDTIVQHYTELYGEPVCPNDDSMIWTKETRMQYAEFILLEEGNDLNAFVVYCSLDKT